MTLSLTEVGADVGVDVGVDVGLDVGVGVGVDGLDVGVDVQEVAGTSDVSRHWLSVVHQPARSPTSPF